ncbi:MAG: methyltransferase domain-containing protein [Planctomycetaceae bacterium]|nr:methyltransferase domain-containing protein [Planctomycetaceae bacterium]
MLIGKEVVKPLFQERKNTVYPFTEKFMASDKNVEFLKAAMMGPNAMRLSEELSSHLKINENMRILDLGCGCGLSTLFLVKQYGASVFAADLWISPTENHERFKSLGIDGKVVPISVDATKGLPFANGYFDLLFTVDAYHHFGDTEDMLPSLIPFVKKGGTIAIAIPGIKYEFGANVPDEMKPFWNDEVARTLHSIDWWKELWKKAAGMEIVDIREMTCCRQAWSEWLTAYSPYAAEDIKMMEAEGGKYFNLIQMTARVI